MEETKTLTKEEKQQDFLNIFKTIVGVQFWLPEKCVKSIFPMEDGEYLYVYNTSVIGVPNCFQKIEVHENKYGKLLVQLVNNKLDKTVLWYKYFNDTEDFKNKIGVIKEFITTLRTI